MAGNTNKNRKYGRTAKSASNQAYKAQNRKRKNKLRKLKTYCAYNPDDKQAKKALKRVNDNPTWGFKK